MKLYYSPGVCSLSPHIVMREAGIPIELNKVNLESKQIEGGGDYTKINSKGSVPSLEVTAGQYLTEGPAIVQYLADQKPESGLVPKAGTLERYRVQEWLNYITSEMHKSFSPLFDKSLTAEHKQTWRTKLEKKFDWLTTQLEGKQYLMGEKFTVADAYLFTVLNWTNYVNIDLKRWPALAQYQARVAERPKVREALQAEGLLQ